MRQFFYIFLVTLFFTGCIETKHEKDDLKVRTFLTNKDKSFYLFLSEKYSFVFHKKHSVDNINKMFKIYNELKYIEIEPSLIRLGEDPHGILDHLTKKDKDRADLHITFYADSKKVNINKLKKYNFRKVIRRGRWQGYYTKSFFLYGKYTLTDKELLTKYRKNFLKKPLKFRYVNRNNSKTSYNPKRTSELLIALGGAPVGIPLMVAAWGTFAAVGVTATAVNIVTK